MTGTTASRTPRHRKVFGTGLSPLPRPLWGDVVVLLGVGAMIYAGAALARQAPLVLGGRPISLDPAALPVYAVLSLGRMAAAYVLSVAFSLWYGSRAARSRRAERFLMPLLDVLQSVPILSFLPVVLLALAAVLPQALATELAAITLIFTSQVWNLTFAWYQALTTIPTELREASRIFGLGRRGRLLTLELPFGAIPLLWNSMMSWAGGWFFLMAAEIFTVGERDFRLPGLGAYLHEAAAQGNVTAIAWGVATLVVLITALDQLLWRPLLVWADRFKLETVEGEQRPTSWFYDALRQSRLAYWTRERARVWRERHPERPEATPTFEDPDAEDGHGAARPLRWALAGVAGLAVVYGAVRAAGMLAEVSLTQWGQIALATALTALRVAAALAVALLWTIPAGVVIGSSRRVARWLQPVVQVAAAVPATALFPVVLLLMLQLPGGLNVAAVVLMLMGTQWYLLFNAIAGSSAIPQDLRYASAMLRLSRAERWRTLVLPALFPYLVTGAITATGGAWNASIVAEYTTFGGRVLQTRGLGALISGATAVGDFPPLLAATLAMVAVVVATNRLVWRPLYAMARDRFRMEA